MLSNLYVFNLYPKKEFNIKLPHPPQHISFELKNVNLAFANAIRRVCEAETPTKRFNLESLETNDVFLIQEYLAIQLRSIPLSIDTPDKKYTLIKEIDSMEDVILSTDDVNGISQYANKMPVSLLSGKIKNAPIITKNSDKIYIKATLSIIEKKGVEHGAHNQCLNNSAVLQYVNIAPSAYGGESSAISTPTHFYIKMVSKNGISVINLFKLAISEIIKRLNRLNELSKNYYQDIEDEEIYILEIDNENCTIAELIFTEVNELYPETELFTYDHRKKKNTIIFRSRYIDLDKIIKTTVESLTSKFKKLEKEFTNVSEIDCFGVDDLVEKKKEKFKHLPLLEDSAEIAEKKTGMKNLISGWLHL
jgi:hypothetical protein